MIFIFFFKNFPNYIWQILNVQKKDVTIYDEEWDAEYEVVSTLDQALKGHSYRCYYGTDVVSGNAFEEYLPDSSQPIYSLFSSRPDASNKYILIPLFCRWNLSVIASSSNKVKNPLHVGVYVCHGFAVDESC